MPMTDQNFSMYRGDSRRLIITVTDANGDPKPLTGSFIRWAMARDRAAPIAVQKITGDGITITDPAGGEFAVYIYPADTEDFDLPRSGSRSYYHEAEVTDSAGAVATVTTGTVTVLRDLIR